MTALAMEARREVIATAEALMVAHPGAVVEAVELRGNRVGLCAHLPGAWRLGDPGEVGAWLEAEASASATALAWALMTRDGTGGEDDRVATMARMLAQRGWPTDLVRQAAEGAEVAGYPGERAFWERVADELDAIEVRNQFRAIQGGANRRGALPGPRDRLVTPAARYSSGHPR